MFVARDETGDSQITVVAGQQLIEEKVGTVSQRGICVGNAALDKRGDCPLALTRQLLERLPCTGHAEMVEELKKAGLILEPQP